MHCTVLPLFVKNADEILIACAILIFQSPIMVECLKHNRPFSNTLFSLAFFFSVNSMANFTSLIKLMESCRIEVYMKML